MQGQRNNFLAGLLVVMAMLGLVVAVWFLGGGSAQWGKQRYIVEFPLDVDVTGLKKGSIVDVGGLEVGSVLGNDFQRDSAGAITGIDVRIAVDSGVEFKQGVVAVLKKPLLGSSGTISFENLGQGPGAVSPGDTIQGRGQGGLLASAGFGAEQQGQIRNIIAQIDDIVTGFNEGGSLENVEAIIANLRENWPQWRDRFTSILDSTNETMAKGPELMDDAKGAVAEGKKVFTDTQEVIAENRDDFAATIDRFKELGEEARAFAKKMNDEMADKAIALLDNANNAIDDAQPGIESFSRLLVEENPNVRKMLANMRLSTDQLRNTMIEVRRAPWRLLYRPGERESDFELLYDSARSYASAVSDLRAASERLKVVASDASPGSVDTARAEQLFRELQQAFESYQEAESLFLERLREGG